jgi:hypothetical protein
MRHEITAKEMSYITSSSQAAGIPARSRAGKLPSLAFYMPPLIHKSGAASSFARAPHPDRRGAQQLPRWVTVLTQ